MVKGVTVVSHKCVGTESSKISTFDLQQTKIFESSSFWNRQHHCTTLPCETEEQGTKYYIKQRIKAVSLETPDHNYWRVTSKFVECGSRLAVWKTTGNSRKTLPKSISTSLPEEENAQSRFLCIKAVSPTTPSSTLLGIQSFQSWEGCPTTDLGQSIPLCIFPILPSSKSLEESELQPNGKNVFCHTN